MHYIYFIPNPVLPVPVWYTFAVGAIVGMTVVMRGFSAVVWSQHQDAFPYIKGMVPIFLSWIVSPFLAAICVIILYGLILRPLVLRSQHSFVRAFYVSTIKRLCLVRKYKSLLVPFVFVQVPCCALHVSTKTFFRLSCRYRNLFVPVM